MSCGNPHETPCHDVLHAIVLYIDHELEDQNQVQAIDLHIQECPPCREEMDHEAAILAKLRQRMSDCFCEEAPAALINNLFAQTAQLAQQMQAQFFGFPAAGPTVTTQYSRTEFTVDGVTHSIEIESTEITHEFPEDR